MFPWNLLCQATQMFAILAWFHVPIGVRAIAKNTTIDDADSQIRYSPGWNASGACDECSTLIPEKERKNAYQSTWHDARNWEANMHFNLTFTGSACYVYGILRDGNQTKIGYSTLASLTFIMDGSVVDHFDYEPSSEDRWLFNQRVFSKDNMTEGSHNLTVRVKPKSLFIFDYLTIISDPSNSPSPAKDNTTIIAPIVGVLGGLAFIGLIWFCYRLWRKTQGVKIKVPSNPFLPTDHPRRPDSPSGHISPYYTPQEVIASHPEYDGDHEGTILLAGPPVTGDRKKRYDGPGAPVFSHSLHYPRRPQVASTSTVDFPSEASSPQPATTSYAPSSSGGTKETVYSPMTPNYAHSASESWDPRSAPSTQTAAVIPMRPLRLTIPSSSPPPPVQPVPRQMSLYPPAVTGAEVSQRRLSEQTIPPPSRPPIRALPIYPPQ